MPPIIPAAQPSRKVFDPWNTTATGHQTCKSNLAGTPSWRDSRTAKLREQFSDTADPARDLLAGNHLNGGQEGLVGGGGKRLYDSVGAGSRDFGKDGRKENGGWERGACGLRKGVGGDLKGWLRVGGKVGVEAKLKGKNKGDGKAIPMRNGAKTSSTNATEKKTWKMEEVEEEAICRSVMIKDDDDPTISNIDSKSEPPKQPTKIFAHLTIYINGSTYPLISDHKLKYLLTLHGANISIALARRTVTHVILGTPSTPITTTPTNLQNPTTKTFTKSFGAGGALASSKIQKELHLRHGSHSIKYITAEWVLQSIAAGKRLPESRFGIEKLRGQGQGRAGQRSVHDLFSL
ncbi:hypothetical protein MMC09_004866 [Bachmanniomyces sp. S44760]|nr:hypothetical protein [Bachmanniomyces sp. S44760]